MRARLAAIIATVVVALTFGAAPAAAVTATPTMAITNAAMSASLVSPADLSVTNDTTPTLEGMHNDPEGDTGQLTFEVCTDPTCSAPGDPIATGSSAAGIANGSNGTWTVTPALTPGIYYWRADSTDQYGGSDAPTATYQLRINEAPGITLDAPADNAFLAGADGVLQATYTDAGGDMGTLRFEVCADAGCATVVTSATFNGNGPGGTVAWSIDPALAPNATYWWRVRATDQPGLVVTSSIRRFLTPAVSVLRGVVENVNGVMVAVGTGNLIVRSADDGATFTHPAGTPVFGTQGWLAIDAEPTSGTFVAVGYNGGIMTSANGTAWTPKTSNATTQKLLDVATPVDDTYWVVGEGGLIMRSTDAGVTWGPNQVSGTIDDITAITALSAAEAYAVTAGGELLYTADGGANWGSQPVVSGLHLTDVAAQSSTDVQVADTSGGYTTSSDGGATFGAAMTTPLTGALRAIASLTGSTALAVGNGGVVRTTDSGATWNLTHAVGTTLHGLHMLSSNDAWAVGNRHTILRTTDGGLNWSEPHALPRNTAPPTISGSAAVGAPLSVSPGTWAGPAATYSYLWERCDTAGANCSFIAGQTASTYTPVAADAGNTLRAMVTATNVAGQVGQQTAAVGPAFTINSAPSTPTSLTPPAGSAIGLQPTFTAAFTDPDALDGGRLEFQMCADVACITVLASGTSVAVGNGASASWSPTGGVPTGRTMHWRVRGVDTPGAVGPYSLTQAVATPAVLQGGATADVLTGSTGDDEIDGGAGNDEIDGGDGDDIVRGGEGDDVLTGCIGNDQLFGGPGRDRLIGCAGNDVLSGGAANDSIVGQDGNDTIVGNAGNDRIDGGGGDDSIKGGAGKDTLVGGAGSDKLDGGAGNDVIDATEKGKLKGVSARDADERRRKFRSVDTVRCGKGFDRVKADANDKVARDCEQVTGQRRRKFR